MARTKNYEHYCVIARSLEVIGEKWSLLLVRDLCGVLSDSRTCYGTWADHA